MSHKKRRSEPSAEPAPQAVADRAAGQDADREDVADATPEKRPSRLAKAFLILASLLLVGWVSFLVILAILAARPKA